MKPKSLSLKNKNEFFQNQTSTEWFKKKEKKLMLKRKQKKIN